MQIHWTAGNISAFDCRWLFRFSMPDIKNGIPDSRLLPVPLRSRAGEDGIPTVTLRDLDSEDGIRNWMETLNRDGVCIVTGVPLKQGMVLEVARKIGPVMRTIYGEVHPPPKKTTLHSMAG